MDDYIPLSKRPFLHKSSIDADGCCIFGARDGACLRQRHAACALVRTPYKAHQVPMAGQGRPPFLILSAAVQTYAWGKRGYNSEAGRLKSCGDEDFTIDEEQTYAELWMGTHKKGPSTITHPKHLSGTLLSDWLKDNEWALGEKVASQFEGQLPFLFKVLSINQALSIQAHPDKGLAQELHKRAPDKYTDPNHKPEMVIAYRDFLGLCGFRSLQSIREFIMEIPEFQTVLGPAAADTMISLPRDAPPRDRLMVMKLAFSALMHADPVLVREQLDCFKQRMREKEAKFERVREEESLVVSLHELYPGDVGCFCVFFLNIVQLFPGHAMFLQPNEPHCYIRGEVIECMACSDNVVRAGLTQKFKDKDTLCEMLTYNATSTEKIRIIPHKALGNKYSEIYNPPTPEFAVARIKVGLDEKEFWIPAINGPSILLIVQGTTQMTVAGVTYQTNRGNVIFLPARQRANFVCIVHHEIIMFRAYCEL